MTTILTPSLLLKVERCTSCTPPPYRSHHMQRLNSDITQAIRNNVLSTLCFLLSAHLVDHGINNCLTPQKPKCTLNGFPKVHIPYSKPNVEFMYSTFLWSSQNLYILPSLSSSQNLQVFQNQYTLLGPAAPGRLEGMPLPPLFCVAKRKKENKGEKERVSK